MQLPSWSVWSGCCTSAPGAHPRARKRIVPEQAAGELDPVTVMARSLQRDGSALSALERLRKELSGADHLGVLGAIWHDLARYRTEKAPRTKSDTLLPRDVRLRPPGRSDRPGAGETTPEAPRGLAHGVRRAQPHRRHRRSRPDQRTVHAAAQHLPAGDGLGAEVRRRRASPGPASRRNLPATKPRDRPTRPKPPRRKVTPPWPPCMPSSPGAGAPPKPSPVACGRTSPRRRTMDHRQARRPSVFIKIPGTPTITGDHPVRADDY